MTPFDKSLEHCFMRVALTGEIITGPQFRTDKKGNSYVAMRVITKDKCPDSETGIIRKKINKHPVLIYNKELITDIMKLDAVSPLKGSTVFLFCSPKAPRDATATKTGTALSSLVIKERSDFKLLRRLHA